MVEEIRILTLEMDLIIEIDSTLEMYLILGIMAGLITVLFSTLTFSRQKFTQQIHIFIKK